MRFAYLMVLLGLLFSSGMVQADTSRACNDYCTNGVYYYDGTYSTRNLSCQYAQSNCPYGCNTTGTLCATGPNTRTTSTTQQPTTSSGTTTTPAGANTNISGTNTRTGVTPNPISEIQSNSSNLTNRTIPTIVPEDLVSESNPQPSPSPTGICVPPDCSELPLSSDSISERTAGAALVSESNPQPSPQPLTPKSGELDLSKWISPTTIMGIAGKNGLTPNQKNEFVTGLTEIYNAAKGFLGYWPSILGAEYYGSEILLENHARAETTPSDPTLTGKGTFEDLFTFYLPGDICSLVVDSCVPAMDYDATAQDLYGSWRPYLDELAPLKLYFNSIQTEYAKSWGVANGSCPQGFNGCEFFYKFTPSKELKKEGLSECLLVSDKSPTEGFTYEGEVCNSLYGTMAKTLEEDDGKAELQFWHCGLVSNALSGKAMCTENTTNKLVDVLPKPVNSMPKCRNYKAENIQGGYHFIHLDGDFTYLRYTYACRKKGLFG